MPPTFTFQLMFWRKYFTRLNRRISEALNLNTVEKTEIREEKGRN
jgi:hypothetical protein